MQDCADTSVFRDIGLRKRASKGIECSKSGNQLGKQYLYCFRSFHATTAPQYDKCYNL